MIELKAIDMIVNDDYKTKVYLKSEADKVIAELKDIIEKNQSAYYVDLGIVAKDCEKLKASEDVLVTDNRNLLDKVKNLENHLRENADHFQRNEAQILENADKEIRHNKYKRCLAMAHICYKNSIACANYTMPHEKYKHWRRWQTIWSELAEKFKRAK